MTEIQYTCQLIQRHMTLSMKLHKTEDDAQELNWLDYKLRLIRRAHRRRYL